MTPQDIKHLCGLLLHPQPQNVALAKALLTPCYSEALPQMRDVAFVYHCFEAQDIVFETWVQEVLTPTKKEITDLRLFHQIAQQAPIPSMDIVTAAFPTWKRYASIIDRHPVWRQAYTKVYYALTDPKYHRGSGCYKKIWIYLLRKMRQYAPASLQQETCRILVRLLRNNTRPQDLHPALIQEVQTLYETLAAPTSDGTFLHDCAQFYEYEVKDISAAIPYYQRSMLADGGLVNNYRALARLARARGDFAGACTWLLKGINEGNSYNRQDYPALFFDLAVVQVEDFGNSAAARDYYRQTLSPSVGILPHSPLYKRALMNWAQLLFQEDFGWKKIRALFEEKAAMVFDPWKVSLLHANFLRFKGRLAEAATLCETLLPSQTWNQYLREYYATLVLQIAQEALDQGALDHAHYSLERGIEQLGMPKNRAHINLLMALGELEWQQFKNYGVAQTHYQSVLRLLPGFPEARQAYAALDRLIKRS